MNTDHPNDAHSTSWAPSDRPCREGALDRMTHEAMRLERSTERLSWPSFLVLCAVGIVCVPMAIMWVVASWIVGALE